MVYYTYLNNALLLLIRLFDWLFIILIRIAKILLLDAWIQSMRRCLIIPKLKFVFLNKTYYNRILINLLKNFCLIYYHFKFILIII